VENVSGKLFVTYAGFSAPFGGVVNDFDTDGHLFTPNQFAANAPGAGMYSDGNSDVGVTSLTLTKTTIAHNQAVGGDGNDGLGIGGGAYLVAGGVAREDVFTLIAHNRVSTSNDDVFGSFTLCR
jgi:hypothetical protein